MVEETRWKKNKDLETEFKRLLYKYFKKDFEFSTIMFPEYSRDALWQTYMELIEDIHKTFGKDFSKELRFVEKIVKIVEAVDVYYETAAKYEFDLEFDIVRNKESVANHGHEHLTDYILVNLPQYLQPGTADVTYDDFVEYSDSNTDLDIESNWRSEFTRSYYENRRYSDESFNEYY